MRVMGNAVVSLKNYLKYDITSHAMKTVFASVQTGQLNDYFGKVVCRPTQTPWSVCKQCRSRSVGFWRNQLIWICNTNTTRHKYISGEWRTYFFFFFFFFFFGADPISVSVTISCLCNIASKTGGFPSKLDGYTCIIVTGLRGMVWFWWP